jgi:hypothetical protein
MLVPLSDDAYLDLQAELWHELKLKPWQWPAVVEPGEACCYPAGSGGARWHPRGQQLYRWLAKAAGISVC